MELMEVVFCMYFYVIEGVKSSSSLYYAPWCLQCIGYKRLVTFVNISVLMVCTCIMQTLGCETFWNISKLQMSWVE